MRSITNMSSLLSGKGSCCRDATLDSKLVDCIIFFAVSDTFSICRPWTGLKRDGYASLCLSVQAVTGSRLTAGLVLHLSHRFKSPRSTEPEIERERPPYHNSSDSEFVFKIPCSFSKIILPSEEYADVC